MSAPPPPPPPRGGMSLYANLLEPKADTTPSTPGATAAFIRSDGAGNDAAAKKPIDSALRFQPIRRPQVKLAKPKATFPKAAPGTTAPTPQTLAAAAPAPSIPAAQQPKSTLADWAATEDDEYLYGTGEKRQRGGRRKKKKKLDNQSTETDWDEIYDPARPTNVEEYLRSDERISEIQDWKAVLYAHRRRRRDSYDSEMASHEDGEREGQGAGPAFPSQFAPPQSYNFAPPPPSPPRATVPDDATGDDAYTRRLAMSAGAPPASASPPLGPSLASPAQPPAPPPAPAPADPDPATITRAPVRYSPPPTAPSPPADAMSLDGGPGGDEDGSPPAGGDAPRPSSRRPGQAGFAERLMSKYGWTRGSGLGAEQSGITSALRVQVEKRRRRPDAEGGGFAEPGGRGRVLGGGRGKGAAEEGGKFGRMSEVVVLRNMLEGMADLRAEMEAGLAQEIGEECGDRYGRVERLFIDIEGRRVFIKFTDQVSALRAVNALEGRIFNGNTVEPRFYDADKFESGVYE